MKKIQKFAKYLRDMIFRRLEAPRRNYEKTMINNMDNLYRVIRKGDIILVEGSSEISRMIKLLTQSSWRPASANMDDTTIQFNKRQFVRCSPVLIWLIIIMSPPRSGFEEAVMALGRIALTVRVDNTRF